jgi:hypothetical protein
MTLSINTCLGGIIELTWKVMARIPVNMIASYLAITPEHLSRIRKKIVSE